MKGMVWVTGYKVSLVYIVYVGSALVDSITNDIREGLNTSIKMKSEKAKPIIISEIIMSKYSFY